MNEKKLREVSICLRHIDNFTRGGALADYEAVYADGVKLQAIWRGKKNAHITTPAGTDLYMEMNDMDQSSSAELRGILETQWHGRTAKYP